MNFDYSDDQKFLKDEARRYLEAKVPLSLVHAALDEPGRASDLSLWEDVKAQGWLGLSIPEAYGGLGAGAVELCAIAEELGRVIAPLPFSSTVYLFAQGLLMTGSEDQKARYLPAVAEGALIGCVGSQDAPGRSLAYDGATLSGAKAPVVDGLVADYAIVTAEEEGGRSLFIVDLQHAQRQPLAGIDPTRPIARLEFDGAPAERLGERGRGEALLRALYSRAAVPFAFEQIGGADRCLELAREYALTRYAFGRPIASFQAMKHKLVDIYVKNQLARSNSYYGAWALDDLAPELPLAAATARVSASEAFWLAAKESLHIHGGTGFTWEGDLQLFYRRAQHLALVLGSAAEWKEQLVSEVIRSRAA